MKCVIRKLTLQEGLSECFALGLDTHKANLTHWTFNTRNVCCTFFIFSQRFGFFMARSPLNVYKCDILQSE